MKETSKTQKKCRKLIKVPTLSFNLQLFRIAYAALALATIALNASG